jgi:CubicO group peptidase (beta-lactamase class C family)
MKAVPIAICALLCCTRGSSASADNTFSDAETAAIQPFLDKHVGNTNSAMVVGLIDENGAKLFSAGKLDNGTDGPVDGDTLFFIGSLSKTFTTLAFLDMVERGEVKLDDPLAKFLPPSVKAPNYHGRQITLNDLATQSSGLPWDPDDMDHTNTRESYAHFTAEKMNASLSAFTLSREPGQEFQYSNWGISLLGEALMRKTGQDFEGLIDERICRPLDMTSTCVTPTPALQPRLAMGHDEAGKPSPPFKLDAYQPAGAILSTVNDLLKYAAAQAGLTHSALSAPIAKSHVIRHTDSRGAPGNETSVFGRTATCWFDENAIQPPGMELLCHPGGAGSYHAWLGFDMKQRRAVVVLTTSNDVSARGVGWTLLQRLPLTDGSTKDYAREMVGIGTALDIDKETHVPRILKVLPDSPAAEAGLTAGLLIQKIDDASTADKPLPDCVKLLRGPAGTKVRLDILDPQLNKTKSVELTRKKFVTGRS